MKANRSHPQPQVQQQFLSQHQRPNQLARSHYSNRQQQQVVVSGSSSAACQKVHSAGSSASSEQDLDSVQQLSSLSAGSQLAMLGPKSLTQREHHQRLVQQHHQAQQRQQQQQQHHHKQQQQQQQNHRQAALAAHGPKSFATAKAAGSQSSTAQLAAGSDNLTTSSSSDHTLDDLHHFGSHSRGRRWHHQPAREGPSQASLATAVQSSSGSRFLLGVLFTLAQLLLFATILLWLYWTFQHDDGLGWLGAERKQQFNGHAALMLAGFVFLAGQAMLIHRSSQCCSQVYTKILHTILLVLATAAISLGLILAYSAQENVGPGNKPIAHFYSLHAWCGLATCCLFLLQFLAGFVSFLLLLCCHQATASFRARLLPIHRTFGLIIFSLAVATSLMGLLQTARSRLR